jgi:hypothetical protein
LLLITGLAFCSKNGVPSRLGRGGASGLKKGTSEVMVGFADFVEDVGVVFVAMAALDSSTLSPIGFEIGAFGVRFEERRSGGVGAGTSDRFLFFGAVVETISTVSATLMTEDDDDEVPDSFTAGSA